MPIILLGKVLSNNFESTCYYIGRSLYDIEVVSSHLSGYHTWSAESALFSKVLRMHYKDGNPAL